MRNWTLSDIERLQNKGMVAGTAFVLSRETKYRNKKTFSEGHEFDSKREANRYNELRLLQHAGEISDLEIQKKFEIKINDQVVCNYISDFCYKENGVIKVEDAKGFRTPTYKLKKRLVKAVLNIDILET